MGALLLALPHFFQRAKDTNLVRGAGFMLTHPFHQWRGYWKSRKNIHQIWWILTKALLAPTLFDKLLEWGIRTWAFRDSKCIYFFAITMKTAKFFRKVPKYLGTLPPDHCNEAPINAALTFLEEYVYLHAIWKYLRREVLPIPICWTP